MSEQQLTVTRVYYETLGSPLLVDVTDVLPPDGDSVAVEAVTDFEGIDDDEVVVGGTIRFYSPSTYKPADPTTYEEAQYADVDESGNLLLGVTRPNPQGWAAGATFVQYGDEADLSKLIDGYLEDTEAIVTAYIPEHLWAWFTSGTVMSGQVVTVDVSEDGEITVRGAPIGTTPTFDADAAVLDPGAIANALPPGVVSDGFPPLDPTGAPVVNQQAGINIIDMSDYVGKPDWVDNVPEYAASTDYSPDTQVGTWGAFVSLGFTKGATIHGPLDYGTYYKYRFRAHDIDNLYSAYSPESTPALPRQVGPGDIQADTGLFTLLNALFIQGGQIQTPSQDASGNPIGHVQIDQNGITVYASDGSPVISQDSQGNATFTGQVVATALVILQTLTVLGATNLTQGSTLTLLNAVANPNTAPTVAWTRDTTALAYSGASYLKGLSYTTTGGSGGATTCFVSTQDKGGNSLGNHLVEINPDGTTLRTYNFDAPGYGAVKIGSLYYALLYAVLGYGFSFYRINQAWTTITFIAAVNVVGNQVGTIATDGLYIYVPERGASGFVNVKKFDVTGTRISQTPTGILLNQVAGAWDQVTDMAIVAGQWYFIIRAVAGPNYIAVTDTAGTYLSASNWPVAPAGGLKGLAYDDANFRGLDAGLARISTYTNFTTAPDVLTAQYSWRDSVGGYNSAASPAAPFDFVARAKLNVSQLPVYPSGVDKARVYVGGKLQSTITKSSVAYTSYNAAGVAPISPSTFPGTIPAKIASTAGSLVFDGNGNWQAALMRQVSADVTTSQTTASTTYTDLATVGPAVTITAPLSGSIEVTVSAEIANVAAGNGARMSFETTGTATDATDANGAIGATAQQGTCSRTSIISGLTPGASVTATARYKTNSGTATFVRRRITARPLP